MRFLFALCIACRRIANHHKGRRANELAISNYELTPFIHFYSSLRPPRAGSRARRFAAPRIQLTEQQKQIKLITTTKIL